MMLLLALLVSVQLTCRALTATSGIPHSNSLQHGVQGVAFRSGMPSLWSSRRIAQNDRRTCHPSRPRIGEQTIFTHMTLSDHVSHNSLTTSSDARTSPRSLNSTTTIANTTFRIPTATHLTTISSYQIQHPLTSDQTFCISSHLCRHSHPQSFGFHPAGSKLSSGLFRLSCPLLVQAIDEWENRGGVREMNDWLLHKDIRTRNNTSEEYNVDWKKTAYRDANEMQRKIRQELLVGPEDRARLVDKLGEYNAQRFMESGVAGMPPQGMDVKCIHAHVADHLCRVSSNTSTSDSASALDDILYGDSGNLIGRRALQILHQKGISILGNDECCQQCNGSEGWEYVPRKNRRGLKSTRMRRKELRNENVAPLDGAS
ncbi:hypothetical protein HJC23_004639 [Cyclotella cryptica]|uniref:Uncharacterized protein n=1 Tax=Cyclotella cryptica TaxID=29204 RepID=A0ABD3QGI2_9STRA